MVHIPGKLLAGPNALSCHPNILPHSDNDNDRVTLLPPSLFINVIDVALSHHIESASTGDPLVLQALQSMNEDIPLCQRCDFPPTTTQPNVGSGKEIPEGGKGESEMRSCQLPEL